MRNKTRLGALLLTMALLIVMLSIGIGATAEPVVTDTPSTARPVLDFSYLPKDQVLTETEGIRPLYSSEQVDEDLVVKAESRSGKDYLHYDVLTQEWCSGKYVDLLVAKDGGKAVTDWSGATTVWFYVETEGTVYCDLLLGVDNSGSGSVQGWFNSLFEGAKYYVEQDGAFVAKATTSDNWNHIVLPENYTGWVGVDVAEGIACKAGHFEDQTFEGHDDTIYGLGFDVDAGDLYVRDFRVSGIAAGLPEKVTISPDDAKPVLNFSYLPIVIDAGYSGWIGVDLQEGLQCKTTELADQTVDGNLGHVYGVGFYLELGDMYVRDFRVAGIAEGVEVPDGPDTSDTSDTSDASDTSDIPNTSDPSDPDSSKGDSSSPETGVDSLAGAAVLLAASALLMVGYQAFARKKATHNR